MVTIPKQCVIRLGDCSVAIWQSLQADNCQPKHGGMVSAKPGRKHYVIPIKVNNEVTAEIVQAPAVTTQPTTRGGDPSYGSQSLL